jgi:hypothetical protein
MTEKECAIIYQTAGVKTVSDVAPIIDSEAEQKAALEQSRDELICKISDIAADYNERMMIVLMPLQERLDKTNRMLLQYNRPSCFSDMGNRINERHSPCESCSHGCDCDKAERNMGRF